MTVTHTSSVFLLGLVTLFLSDIIVPERLLPWLGLASGLIVVGLGIQMVISCLRANTAGVTDAQTHDGAGVHTHGDGTVHHHSAAHGTGSGEPTG